jgi:hypothetical protein
VTGAVAAVAQQVLEYSRSSSSRPHSSVLVQAARGSTQGQQARGGGRGGEHEQRETKHLSNAIVDEVEKLGAGDLGIGESHLEVACS